MIETNLMNPRKSLNITLKKWHFYRTQDQLVVVEGQNMVLQDVTTSNIKIENSMIVQTPESFWIKKLNNENFGLWKSWGRCLFDGLYSFPSFCSKYKKKCDWEW